MDRCGKRQVSLREKGERSVKRGRGDHSDGVKGLEVESDMRIQDLNTVV